MLGTTRRDILLSSAAAVLLTQSSPACAATDVPPARIDLSRAPDQRMYDPADSELRAAANLLQKALNAETVQVKADCKWCCLSVASGVWQ